jgi:5-formyltetrahydrofolate cyclo-ligase
VDDKSRIRSEFLQRRRALTSENALIWSTAIATTLVQRVEFTHAATILTYVASKDHEVDTKAIILHAQDVGKTILAPCTGSDCALTWTPLRTWEDLVPGPYGILEPRRDTREYLVPPDDAPVIVPGIAFSPAGHRIGYGKGYYDRFLAAHHGLKLGLAYEMQIVPSIPSDTHDVPVDLVITETATYDCRG